MKPIRTLSGADQDFKETLAYYNHERDGLGYEFASEIQFAFEHISAFPHASPVFSKRSRRYIVRRFPYGIWYEIRPDHILVLAIMHLERNPTIWIKRLRGAQ